MLAPEPDGLSALLPQVSQWFTETFGEPTPPQRLGWPLVALGRNVLILSPTGSGKTLAAFLAALDHLWRTPRVLPGVRVLYVSPLKALNNDVYRNLQIPLEGILQVAQRMGQPLPALTIGLRTGDTPQNERQRQLRKPPDILITTPESLHLMLTSRARLGLRSISHVIVDEIHAVCGNKRGVFLSLLLERLESINARVQGFARIGLSATQRPLEEVAAYLGGRSSTRLANGSTHFATRPVEIVDAGGRKEFDLQVSAPFGDYAPLQAGEVWPAIETRLFELIRSHRSTIIFANNRRIVERLTARLNERAATEALDNAVRDPDLPPPIIARSHHGSLSLPERRETEEALKNGELSAVVSTASLELGIDMGAVDLVCQVESPGSVSRGLQRVGRAGHLVGRTSKGRLLCKTSGDLLESAALCQGMRLGAVETLKVPTNCLDVLAQQVVACVAAEPSSVADLFDLVRRCYPYRDLTAEAFEGVLRMVSGRFPLGSLQDLKARITWDRVHNRLLPLPGSARLALTCGGTIPDTGQYPLYLGENGPKLGELDEEFVLERRVGETFVLGTSTWKIDSIDPLRVVVSRAEGQSAMMPFWRGENSPRSLELGERVGRVSREIASRRDDPTLPAWLSDECRLDEQAARSLMGYVARQVRAAGVVPDDRTVLVETFRDPAGEVGLAVLTPFGGKLHGGLKLALQGRLRERLGVTVACFHSDDGLLIRIPRTLDPPLNLFEGLDPKRAEDLIRAELGDSALFGLRFRQNAGRALLMPRPDPSKRTPLYLQRLRARDLLQVVRKFPDYPIVVETYRECLNDDLDLPMLRRFLEKVGEGSIRIVTRDCETSSPFASSLIFKFTQQFLYKWDEPVRGDRSKDVEPVDTALLDALLEPSAIGRVEARLRGLGHPPRTPDEMAETLRQVGDLTPLELFGPMAGFLETLETEGRARRLRLEKTASPDRWISSEDMDVYDQAFGPSGNQAALSGIVARYLRSHALIGLNDLIARYPIDPAQATDLLERSEAEGGAIRLEAVDDEGAPRWADPGNLDEVRRLSLAIRRRESVSVRPEVFADFVARRQCLHPSTRREGRSAVGATLADLCGFPATLELWETEILPRRVAGFRAAWLDETVSTEGWVWIARGEGRGDSKVGFVGRDFPGPWPKNLTGQPEAEAETTDETDPLGDDERRLFDHLQASGAEFATDLARRLGRPPSLVREALNSLSRRGLATNDRLEVLRPEAKALTQSLAESAETGRAGRMGLRRKAAARPEGRWSLAPTGRTGEEGILAWIEVLLDRYGVLTRETAELDTWAPPWREMTPWLAKAELRGEIRRGYFVEGLSGVQYASEEAAASLSRLAGDDTAEQPAFLVPTLDPACLYGSGAPFDVPLLSGGTARLSRNASNYLVLIAGRPVLIIEGAGKRLTGLASASQSDLEAAVALLPTLAGPGRRVLKVETYNDAAALASPAVPWLTSAGFVRMHPGMAFYAGWS